MQRQKYDLACRRVKRGPKKKSKKKIKKKPKMIPKHDHETALIKLNLLEFAFLRKQIYIELEMVMKVCQRR